ncbi:CapA family protein [Peptoniphilus mikwangii]|uniref:CapA family protein n=1 Tax=Peptoniphilus mikwangii TaxID=1354300 RepID=UPI000406DEB5|nr:CapA family protein [Peptoniphilus mikwangii]
MKKIFFVLSAILILIVGFVVVDYSTNGNISGLNFISKEPVIKKNTVKQKNVDDKPEKKSVTILATGDIMYHLPLYIRNFDETKGKYDFSTYYAKMKEYIDLSDITVGNFESTVNPNRRISGHPMFNTPKEALEYLKEIGFDVLSTVNNHCIDTHAEGIETTIDEMDNAGLKHFGTYKTADRPMLVVEKNDIKIGFIGYSEIFNGLESLVPKDRAYMISPLDEELIKEDISKLKSLGADFIIAYPHWGVEYSKEPSEVQKYFNDYFLNLGVDAVLGSHPHVLQPVKNSSYNGKKTFTIFSMGNSISNQRIKWLPKDGVETGVFVKLYIDKENGVTSLTNVELIPTYVNRYIDEKGKPQSEVLAYKDIIDGGKYRDTLDDATKAFVDKNYNLLSESLREYE